MPTEKSVVVKTELVNLTSTSAQFAVNATTLEAKLYDIMYHKLLEMGEQGKEQNPEQHESAEFIDKLGAMCRKIIAMDSNCILFTVRCPTLDSLHDLMHAINANTLQQSFAETYFTKKWKENHGIASIDVKMAISPLEYAQCERELTASGRV